MNKLFRRCSAFLQRSRVHTDPEEEMRTHRDMKPAELRSRRSSHHSAYSHST